MHRMTKLAIVAGVLALCACASGRYGDQSTMPGEKAQVDCSTVRCAECPELQTPALKPPNCCRCVPVDTKIKDCSTVRCAACPEGQHPALTPPDCCRCVPD
ncbi:MAG TPA: hypothetical protein VGX68_18610 [Thermoanaerobaculia bacterium]|nr:hypothetical protein [Thermoanaerobaculia bacterium]